MFNIRDVFDVSFLLEVFISTKGSAGGLATAKIEKEQAKLRIDEYNSHPNLCLCCQQPIIAPYNRKLRETKKKKFCSRSCAAKYNNKGQIKNKDGKGLCYNPPLIDMFTDDEVINAFKESSNITEFSKKLGYKTKIRMDSKPVNNRLSKLGLDLKSIKKQSIDILATTKGELFDIYQTWQTARTAIAKNAREIYSLSNKPKQCVCCGYNKHFEVAHIKSVSSFENSALISEINSIDNLIALCPNHHWEYDNTDFQIEPYLNKIKYNKRSKNAEIA